MTGGMEPCATVTLAETRCRRTGRWDVDGAAMRLKCWQHAVKAAHDLNLPRIVDLLSGRVRAVEDLLPQPRSTR